MIRYCNIAQDYFQIIQNYEKEKNIDKRLNRTIFHVENEKPGFSKRDENFNSLQPRFPFSRETQVAIRKFRCSRARRGGGATRRVRGKLPFED